MRRRTDTPMRFWRRRKSRQVANLDQQLSEVRHLAALPAAPETHGRIGSPSHVSLLPARGYAKRRYGLGGFGEVAALEQLAERLRFEQMPLPAPVHVQLGQHPRDVGRGIAPLVLEAGDEPEVVVGRVEDPLDDEL